MRHNDYKATIISLLRADVLSFNLASRKTTKMPDQGV